MNPLAVEIWLSMLGAYVMVSLTIWIVARFSPYEWIEPTPCPSCKCPLQVGSRRVVLIDYGIESSETDAERCREKIDEFKFQSQFFFSKFKIQCPIIAKFNICEFCSEYQVCGRNDN